MGELVLKEKNKDVGIGVAGLVMCPFFKGACLKQGCELWVELKFENNYVARCSLSWMAVLSTEIRTSIDGLKILEKNKEGTV